MYTPDLVYEALMDPPPIPDLPPPPPLPPGMELPLDIGIMPPPPPPPPLPPASVEFLSSVEEKGAPTLQASAELQLLLHLEEVCPLPKPPPPHSMLPSICQLLPLQGNKVVLNLVWMLTSGEGEGEGVRQCEGSLVLLGVEEGEGNSTSIVKTPLATLTYDREGDMLQHLCSFPSFIHDHPSSSSSPSHLLAGVTRHGSVRIFSLPDLTAISEYRGEGGCGQYIHCVPCPGINRVAMTTTLGEVHVLELGQQATSLEEEEEGEDIMVPFKGIDSFRPFYPSSHIIPSPFPVDPLQPLTAKQLDLLQELFSSEPEGVLCPALAPPHWEVVPPLKYHRQCPCHMLQPQENAVESQRGEMFSTMMWQYVPQLCSSSAG